MFAGGWPVPLPASLLPVTGAGASLLLSATSPLLLAVFAAVIVADGWLLLYGCSWLAAAGWLAAAARLHLAGCCCSAATLGE